MSNSNIDLVIHQIRSEIKTHPVTGKSVCSIRGTARLANVAISTLLEHFSKDRKTESKLVEVLSEQGFQPLGFSENGIPDMAVASILEYYAFDAGKRCTDQAKLVYRAFARIGVQEWMRDLSGWQKPIQEKIDIKQFVLEQMPDKALPWELRFPPEFWIALEQVYGLKRGQWACSGFISHYVYGYFPKEVRERLNQINPTTDSGFRKGLHHQHFDDVLLKALKMQVSLVTQTLMKSGGKPEFRARMKSMRRYKFTQENLLKIKGGTK